MTRDQLESAIWRAMHRHAIRTPHGPQFVDAVLRAADEYALTGDTPADRRAILAQDPGRTTVYGQIRDLRATIPALPVHYAPGSVAACGKLHGLPPDDPGKTADPRRVTCGSCQRTGHYRRALVQAVAS